MFVRKAEVTTRYRWEDNIKMDLKDVGKEDLDQIHMAFDRDKALVNTLMILWIP
jgi:hypothetical protein